MKQLKYIFKFFLTLVSRLVKVDDSLIIFESNPSYMDNSGALFKYFQSIDEYKNYKIVWFIFDGQTIKNKENNHREIVFKDSNKLNYWYSLILINFYHMRAKYYIYTHRNYISYFPKKNQIIVNLTHGTPIKDSTGRHSSQKHVSTIVTTSKFSRDLRKQTYDGADEDKFIIAGFPRNDLLLKLKEPENLILWLPTYRKHKNEQQSNEFDSLPLSPKTDDIMKINDFLKKIGYKLVLKPHPAQTLEALDGKLSNIKIIDDNYLFENNIHLYQLLARSAILITDYSSVFLDYLLLDRPIIFTFDDLDSYSKDTGFLLDILDYAPGDKVSTVSELIDAMNRITVQQVDLYRDERKTVNVLFNEHKDDRSSQRVLEAIGILPKGE